MRQIEHIKRANIAIMMWQNGGDNEMQNYKTQKRGIAFKLFLLHFDFWNDH